MNLKDIYDSEGQRGLLALARKIGEDGEREPSVGYLWQLATGYKGKRASAKLIQRMVAADPRLTVEELQAQCPRQDRAA